MMRVRKIQVGYLQTNCYILLFDDDDRAIVVDPGGGDDAIDELLEEEGVRKVAVLLTHAHFDHILGVPELRKRYDADVYIHALEKPSLNGKGNMAEAVGLRYLPKIVANKPFSGEPVLNIFSHEVKVMHTPGHTVGSVCYIIEDRIFSGDTLMYECYGRTDFIGGSLNDLKHSLLRLFYLDGDYFVYPGHGLSTELSHEKIFNPILPLLWK